MKKPQIFLIVIALGVVLAAGWSVSTYNGLVDLDQDVRAQWAQVENVYQRRLDLVPNLVATVKAAAKFESDTLVAVVEARSKAARAAATEAPRAPSDPAAIRNFQQVQDELSSALARLMVVVERYPELKAAQNFRDLQAQLEGTENRIAVERKRYNDKGRLFNTKRNSFPTLLVARLFGERFKDKGYFTASPGAERAPDVKF
jgi:LemA protein